MSLYNNARARAHFLINKDMYSNIAAGHRHDHKEKKGLGDVAALDRERQGDHARTTKPSTPPPLFYFILFKKKKI